MLWNKKRPLVNIEYVEDENFVYLKTNGDYTARHVEKFLAQVTEFAKEKNCFRIILDHRNCKFSAEVFEIHRITKHLDKYGFDIKFKGAVVYDQDRFNYTFANTVTKHWSMGILKFFDDFNNAKSWLLNES